MEVSLKRPFIQRLIFELAENENHSLHEGFPSDYNEDHRYSENNKNRTNSLRPEVNGDSSLSHSVQGKQFTLLSAPSPLDPQSFNPSDMVLKEHFKPGTMAGTSLGHCQSLDQQSSDHYLNGSIFSTKVSTWVFVCTCMSCEFFFFLTFLGACSFIFLHILWDIACLIGFESSCFCRLL